MLIEKLEEELRNLKEMLPINESRHVFTLVIDFSFAFLSLISIYVSPLLEMNTRRFWFLISILQVQMEYIEVINTMKNKNKTLTEKLNDEYRAMCEKDEEIRRLQDNIDRLSKMLDHKMTEIEDSKNELRCEREKFRSLERDIVDVEKKLFRKNFRSVLS